MKPVYFHGHNAVLAKDQPEYLPLPVNINPVTGQVISCWQPSVEEVVAIAEATARGEEPPVFWISQLTFGNPLQPQCLQLEVPEMFDNGTFLALPTGESAPLRMWQPQFGPMPPWAIAKADAITDLGAQLCTRDGRACGNAVLIGSKVDPDSTQFYLALTDAGTLLTMTLGELRDHFYDPEWVMDPRTAPGWLRFDEMNPSETCSYCGQKGHRRPDCPEIAALVRSKWGSASEEHF